MPVGPAISASRATGEVLVFLDADLLVGPDAIAGFVRWYDRSPACVVTGTIGFVDLAGLDLAALDAAISSRSLAAHLAGRAADDQAWRENTFRRTCDLTVDESDLFRIWVGAVMCVPRALHESIGGLRELGMRGIEDTEYGYRLHNAGGLFVLDRSIELWHQGKRFFDTQAAKQVKSERRQLMDELIAEPSFRASGRTPRRVPMAVVQPAGGEIEGLAGSARADVEVLHDSGDVEERRDLAASPFRFVVLGDSRFGPDSVDDAISWMYESGIGVVHLVDPEGNDLVRVLRTRALGRAGLLGAATPAEQQAEAGRLFGEWRLPADQFGIAPA
ncbi:MAG: glycosyltransferase [Acidimicrobiales bacterium]